MMLHICHTFEEQRGVHKLLVTSHQWRGVRLWLLHFPSYKVQAPKPRWLSDDQDLISEINKETFTPQQTHLLMRMSSDHILYYSGHILHRHSDPSLCDTLAAISVCWTSGRSCVLCTVCRLVDPAFFFTLSHSFPAVPKSAFFWMYCKVSMLTKRMLHVIKYVTNC